MPPTATDQGVSLRLQGVRRVFEGSVVAVESLDLSIDPGQFVAILGPSGCGKSTLLRLIAGLDKPDAGTIHIEGLSDANRHNRVAYVFQDAHLLPWRTVLANAALPLEFTGHRRGERLDAARQVLESVGLSDALRRYPAQLSGGMRMRVSLARALVTQPKLLLLDEPFAALDEITRQELDEQLLNLWRCHGMTVLFVTHSTAEATYLAQRAVVLTKRPARIVLDKRIDLPDARPRQLRGTPEFVRQTADIYAALERGGRAVIKRYCRAILPPVITFVLLMAAAETVVRLCHIKAYILPPPSDVFRALADPKTGPNLRQAALETAEAASKGLGLSIAIGLAVGVILSSGRWVERAFYPYAVFFQTVPIIAIAPLLVIWIGYGMPTVIASAFIVSLFPVIANTLAGLHATDPALTDLFRLYRAGPIASLLKLRLPSALPSIITGLRVASGLAVIGAIVGEFIAGGGLGIAIQVSIKYQRTDLTFAAILLASLLGLALFALVNLTGYLLLRHRQTSTRR